MDECSFSYTEGRKNLRQNIVVRSLSSNLPQISEGIVEPNKNEFFACAILKQSLRVADCCRRSLQEIIVPRVCNQQAGRINLAIAEGS